MHKPTGHFYLAEKRAKRKRKFFCLAFNQKQNEANKNAASIRFLSPRFLRCTPLPDRQIYALFISLTGQQRAQLHETMPRSRQLSSALHRNYYAHMGAPTLGHRDTGTLGLPIHRSTSLLTRFFKLPLALDRAHAAGPGGIWKRWGSRKTTYNTDAQWSWLAGSLEKEIFPV